VSVVIRNIASVPVRTSVGTWKAIVDLLAPAPGLGRDELLAVTNAAAILISEEYTAQAPIIVVPASGARVRVRTVHGEDAIATQSEERALTVSPCLGTNWSVSLPCGIDDVDEIRAALDAHTQITVRDLAEGLAVELPEQQAKSAGTITIDYEEMNR
jgi:hypothetical protein